jgi:hypothetical protein
MKKDYVLIKFSKYWADEFIVQGCKTMEEEKWHKIVEALMSIKDKTFSYYFGTNEGFEELKVEEYIKSLEVTLITEEDHKLIKTLGLDNFGLFPCFEDIIESLEQSDITPELKALGEDYPEWEI